MHILTLERIVERFGLEEVHGSDGGAYLPLTSHMPLVEGSLGHVRVFRGGPIAQLVTSTIVVPPIGLDSHMLFAFMPTTSPVPHFTVDSVRNGNDFAFHLDLIPRVDLAVQLAYMDEVFGPLTELFQQHRQLAGLSPAQLDPRQYAVMSPWMLVNRANEAAFRSTFASVDAYLDHWFGLVENGVSATAVQAVDEAQLAARDAAHRAVIFNADVDKVWERITPLIGAEAVAESIALLRDTSR